MLGLVLRVDVLMWGGGGGAGLAQRAGAERAGARHLLVSLAPRYRFPLHRSADKRAILLMMLSEAGVINLLDGNLRETMSTYKKKKYVGLTPKVLQDHIHESLSRLASPEWAKYMAACDELKLFDTKGRDYDNMIGKKVVVTYNEQDAEGYEIQVDYAGIVVALDPFWMDVKFELVPASGVFDGVVCDVSNDEDEWEWANTRRENTRRANTRRVNMGVGKHALYAGPQRRAG